jgi:hypothetical protein
VVQDCGGQLPAFAVEHPVAEAVEVPVAWDKDLVDRREHRRVCRVRVASPPAAAVRVVAGDVVSLVRRPPREGKVHRPDRDQELGARRVVVERDP